MNKNHRYEKFLLWLFIIAGLFASMSFRVLTTGRCDPKPLYWDRGTTEFNSILNYRFDLVNAQAIWNSYLPSAMRQWVVHGVLDRPRQRDGANVVLIDRLLNVTHPGIAYYAYQESGRIVEVDIAVRHDLALYQNPNRYTIFLHELGHFLGAAYSDVSSAVMWHQPYNHSTLDGDDIAFINVHYGGGSGGCNSATSPCPNFETFIDVFKQTVDSTLYAANTPGADYKVATLVNEVKQPGTYEVMFDASGLASGVYYYRLSAGNFVNVKKLMLVK